MLTFDKRIDEYSHDVVGVDIGPRKKKGNPVNFWRRGPKPGLLIQLAFHDCLRYADGSGGCDGCLNWAGMGYRSPKAMSNIQVKHPEWVGAWPKQTKTNNNKLQLSARSLELIYTLTDWPPGAKELSSSLKESGKSRADLWQFAGNVALERVIKMSNENCNNDIYGQNIHKSRSNPERHVSAIEGRQKCEMKLEKPIPFRSGRIDCIPNESLKWSPYPFEATKEEKHSNPHGTGDRVIKDLKEDFNLTARETISLMALHGLSGDRNDEMFTKYNWIGGTRYTFSNMYFKFLNGKTFWRGNADAFTPGKNKYPKYFIGDKSGNPVGGTTWQIQCKSGWNDTESGAEKRNNGGPCHFRPSHPGT